MVTKPSTEQTQDFSIHNEDFPALPGPNYKDPTLNNDDSKTVSHTAHWQNFFIFFVRRVQIKRIEINTCTIFPAYWFFSPFPLELELHKQEHIQCRWAQVSRRQDGLSTEQQPEERDSGVAWWWVFTANRIAAIPPKQPFLIALSEAVGRANLHLGLDNYQLSYSEETQQNNVHCNTAIITFPLIYLWSWVQRGIQLVCSQSVVINAEVIWH